MANVLEIDEEGEPLLVLALTAKNFLLWRDLLA